MDREQTTIRIPKELKAALEKEAADRGMSFNALVLIYCREGLARK